MDHWLRTEYLKWKFDDVSGKTKILKMKQQIMFY